MTVEFRQGRRGTDVYLDGRLYLHGLSSFEAAENAAFDLLRGLHLSKAEAGRAVKAATRRMLTFRMPGRKNPVRVWRSNPRISWGEEKPWGAVYLQGNAPNGAVYQLERTADERRFYVYRGKIPGKHAADKGGTYLGAFDSLADAKACVQRDALHRTT
jgi:hypothetical protein